MATTTKYTRWTGELLPRLKNFLEYRGIPNWWFTINHQLTGYMNDRAVFVAKKQIWREQVSTQKHIVKRSIECGKWIIFYIPNTWLLAFDPKIFWENSWQNKRWDELMLNIHTKFGKWIAQDEIMKLKPLQYDLTSQLTIA